MAPISKLINAQAIISRGIYNVLDYGINDSNSPESNSARLNGLIEKVSRYGGGTIYFPAMNYYFNSPNYLKNNITFVGDGWGSILLYSGNSDFIIIGETDLTKKYENIFIENLYLKCINNSNNGSAIKLIGGAENPLDGGTYTPRRILFNKLKIEEFGFAGINVDYTCINVFYQNLWIKRNGRFGIKVGVDCDVSHCFIGENGIKYPGDFYNCNILVSGADSRITDCHIWGWGAERGILIDYAGDVHISNCVIEEHSKEGILIYNSSTCRIVNNYLEDNSFGNYNLYSAIKIIGNYGASNPAYYTQITGNRFGKQIWGGIQAGHRYCVEEEGAFVDYTYFALNYAKYGYVTGLTSFIGTNSRSGDNYL